jgi:hypothetical protein
MHDFPYFGKDIEKQTEGSCMHHLTTRELLYLEDMSSLFESIAKNCDYAAGSVVDPHLKSYCQSLSNEHRQWVSATTSFVTDKSKLQ